MPGIIELSQLLMTPGGGEDDTEIGRMSMWQVSLKTEFRGLTYAKVFAQMVSDESTPALPLGILRRFDHNTVTADGRQQLDVKGLGYVWTNPNQDTLVQDTDLLFCLGDQAFGKAAYEEGLLPL